jgi:hypothetical protein
MLYALKTGIWEGHEFNGRPMLVNGLRMIYDTETIGLCYPSNECSLLDTQNEDPEKTGSKYVEK